MQPTTIGAWIGVAVAAGGVIAGSVKFAFWVYDEWQRRKNHQGFVVPKKTLQIAGKIESNYWWGMGKRGDEPTMQIVGSFFISNISSVPVRVPQAELRYGFLGRKRVNGIVMVPRSAKDNLHGFYDIPPNETRNAPFDFWIYPPVAKVGEDFTARSVTFIDQFGNRHSVKKVTFRPHDADRPKPPKRPAEFAYEIADPVEKEVVSALQSELARYQMCGRTVGGLGSVHIVYRGRTFTGVGTDSWTPDSPINQLIVSDPDAASLCSDNLDAVVAYYNRLRTDDERDRFIAALTERLDAEKGYLEVAYFAVCVLLKIGQLGRALQKAKQDLPAGEQKAFGLSNVLMLLNGLLKYRHPDFTSEMLDEIERLIHNLNEHPFLIPQKLSAIRTSRLANA